MSAFMACYIQFICGAECIIAYCEIHPFDIIAINSGSNLDGGITVIGICGCVRAGKDFVDS